MKIEYNRVTWYSTVIAVILYVGTFLFAFYLGEQAEAIKNIANPKNSTATTTTNTETDSVINSVTFNCDSNKTIQAIFFKDKVELTLSDGRNMLLSQGISASGARYANSDESFVFWNKGDTAFVQEGDKTTFDNCSIAK